MALVRVSSAAVRDLRRVRDRRDLDRLEEALYSQLATEPVPANLDVQGLAGHRPWLRLRVGDYRVIFRRLTPAEVRRLDLSGATETGVLVERVISRRDLDRAVRSLPAEAGR